MSPDSALSFNLQKGFSIQTPFAIRLNNGAEELICTKILRNLPERRLVCLSSWQNQTVIAKLFIHPQKKTKDFQQEMKGHEALIHANLNTPKRFFSGQNDTGEINIIVYEYLVGNTVLNVLAKPDNKNSEKNQLIIDTITQIAKMHQLGIRQNDIHLDNFFLVKQNLFILDAASVEQFESAKDKAKLSIENFILFLAELPRDLHESIPAFIHAYETLMNYHIDTKTIFKKIRHEVNKRFSEFKHKMFRNCSAFQTKKTFNTFLVVRRNLFSDIYASINQLDQLIEDGVILKKGSQSIVSQTLLNHQDVIIKRVATPNALTKLMRSFQPSRAARSWKNSLTLEFFAIKTAKPLAIYEKRMGFLRFKSYFLMEAVHGSTLYQYCKQSVDNPHQLESIADKIINLLYILRQERLVHADFKSTNIIICDQNPYLIDLDAMKHYKSKLFFNRVKQKDIKRFLKIWQNEPQLLSFFEEKLKQKHLI